MTDTIEHSLAGVFKFSVTGENDKTDLGIKGVCAFDQFEAGESGHTNINQAEVRIFIDDYIQGFQTVFADTDQIQSQGLPGNTGSDRFTDDFFIVSNHTF